MVAAAFLWFLAGCTPQQWDCSSELSVTSTQHETNFFVCFNKEKSNSAGVSQSNGCKYKTLG